MEEKRVSKIFGRIIVVLFVLIGAFLMIYPFLWMIITSLKNDGGVFIYPPQWIPSPVVWENYLRAWKETTLGRYMFNSVYISVVKTGISLLFNSMAAYALAKYKFKGRNIIFIVLLATMMVPFPVTAVPIVLILKKLSLIDTYTGVIIPGLAGAYGIFLMRQFFMSIHTEFIEAARIDGAGEFKIFGRIVLPMCKPALATLGIFTFMNNWNDYFFPFLVITDPKLRTLPLAIKSLSAWGTQGATIQSWPLLMAVTTIVILPVIIVFFMGQKYFINGIALSGLKG